ncbi:MAG: YggT family protein [Gammaproteobacteria bacterium]
MGYALIFIFKTLFELYILCFLMRLVLQWTRADFHNPLSQFIVRVTNPIVTPLRRLVPPVGNIDTSTLIVFLLMEAVIVALLSLNAGIELSPPYFTYYVLLRSIYTIVRMYVFVILIYAILSFVNPGTYNPLSNVLANISEPVLRPFRRVIPTIGGLDLSPLFVLIGLQAIIIALPIKAWLV